MANQILTCPPTLLASLIGAIETNEGPKTGYMRLDLLGGLAGSEAVCAQVDDPRLFLTDLPLTGRRSFVLLLSKDRDPNPGYQPLPLPDDLVVEMLDRVQDMVSALPGLEGHERLALAALLISAREAPNRAPLQHASRAPGSEYEEQLLTIGTSLGSAYKGQLREFDSEVKRFREHALRSGLAGTIRSLSVEGPVADALMRQSLSVTQANAHHRAWRKVEKRRRRAAAARLTLDSARTASALSTIGAMPCTSRSVYLLIARGSGYDRNWSAESGFWRTREPSCEPGLPPPVPAQALFTALRQFDAAFDRHLLAGMHALVRITLAIGELAGIQPLPSDNARFIDFMAAAMVEEASMAPIPWMLALQGHSGPFRAALSDAAAPPHDMLFRAVLGLARQAIGMGERLVHELGPAFAAKKTAFMAAGVPEPEAIAMAGRRFRACLLDTENAANPRLDTGTIATVPRRKVSPARPIAVDDEALELARIVRQAKATN